MKIEINRETLTINANDALGKARKAQLFDTMKNEEEIKRKKDYIKEVALGIISSVPTELIKASHNPKETDKGLIITAHIPIVEERMFSVMVNEGSLSSDDRAILLAVQEELKTLIVPDMCNIEVRYKTTMHTYADSDSSSYGPCKSYFLEAQLLVPKS